MKSAPIRLSPSIYTPEVMSPPEKGTPINFLDGFCPSCPMLFKTQPEGYVLRTGAQALRAWQLKRNIILDVEEAFLLEEDLPLFPRLFRKHNWLLYGVAGNHPGFCARGILDTYAYTAAHQAHLELKNLQLVDIRNVGFLKPRELVVFRESNHCTDRCIRMGPFRLSCFSIIHRFPSNPEAPSF